jgi:hypothetical protein
MPYVTFPAGTLPGFGRAHASKQDAIDARTADEQIGFDPSQDESDAWRMRESARFADGTYTAVPWADRLLEMAENTPIRIDTESEGKPEAGLYREPYTADESAAAKRLLRHYAHMSVSHPGMVAYTPDETFGHEDRQLRISVGRYMERFGAAFGKDDCSGYVGALKALTGESLQIARTPEDIARVYCAADGPVSCMDGGDFSRRNTPVRVYGNSDLGVAYLGTLHPTDPSKDRIQARGIVWPDKKRYSRLYGDYTTLAAALETCGYSTTRDDVYSLSGNDYGMVGAKIRAIDHPNGGYYMPYVDDAGGADLDGGYFVLSRHGAYNVKDTCGRTEVDEEDTCPNCSDTNDGNGEGAYCDSCRDRMACCDSCSEEFDMESDGSNHDYGTLCGSCSREHSRECEHCNRDFNDYDFSDRERRNRDERLCGRCEDDGITFCDDCEGTTESVDDDCRCSDCAERHAAAEAERIRQARILASRVRPRPRGTVLRVHTAVSAVVLPTIAGEYPNVSA